MMVVDGRATPATIIALSCSTMRSQEDHVAGFTAAERPGLATARVTSEKNPLGQRRPAGEQGLPLGLGLWASDDLRG